jgi:Protein of unknown function (DUF1573)
MKKLLLSLSAIALMATASFAQAKADDLAKIQVETIELGKIPQGTPAPAVFTVVNTGKTDLIIESANPTCGCTIGDYTKTPIAPGKTGTITATYNAAGLGAFEKHMTVKFAGADDTKSITIKGEVLDAAEYAKIKSGIPPAVVTNVPAKANGTPAPRVGVTQKVNKSKVKKATAKVAA